MRDLGPETSDDGNLREWFDDQQRRSLDRMQDAAKTIIQLASGIYGVLFAVLAFDKDRAYLQRLSVEIGGTVSMLALFVALVAAYFVVQPRAVSWQEDNLSEMRRVYRAVEQRKSRWLNAALIAFLVGTGALGVVILAVLWGF